MDDFRRSHVPAFGSWDFDNNLPFTQCFESARQAGLLRYSYSADRDLYVAGELYDNDVVTPAMIVVPRRRGRPHHPQLKEAKKEESNWVGGLGQGCDAKEPPIPVSPPPRRGRPLPRKAAAYDEEDLYKISPELLLYAKPKTIKRGRGFFLSCLLPGCAS